MEHAIYIGERLRSGDARELEAAEGGPIDSVFCVVDSFENSRWCNVALLDDEPAVIYGVAPSPAILDSGSPWLLGTSKAKKLRKQFITRSKSEVEMMLVSYPFLHNLVHSKNLLSIKWLIWLGFKVNFDKPCGTNDEFLFFFKGKL